MYEVKYVFILSHDEYDYIQHSIITIYPWIYNWRFWHFCWYFSDCDFLHNDLFWAIFYLSPWQCFKTVFFDCTGVIIGLHNSFFSPSNECTNCIKSTYYCAVRMYAEKYWLISIFLIKEIKNTISKGWDIVLMMMRVFFLQTKSHSNYETLSLDTAFNNVINVKSKYGYNELILHPQIHALTSVF